MSIYDKIEELENLGVTNPYLRLGVRENATTEEILKAYREAIKKIGINQNQQTVDNNYVIQILTAVKNALTDEEIRKEVDRRIAQRKEGHEIIRSERKNNQSYDFTKATKDLKSDLDIQEIAEAYGLNRSDELSYADIQLILRDYIKRNWDPSRRRCESIIRRYESIIIENAYLLLDKKGSLRCVQEERIGAIRTLSDFFDKTLYIRRRAYSTLSALDYWNLEFKDDNRSTVRLVSLTSILSSELFDRSLGYTFVSQNSLQQGIELGNECLLKLRKNGYLKPTSPNEYIR